MHSGQVSRLSDSRFARILIGKYRILQVTGLADEREAEREPQSLAPSKRIHNSELHLYDAL